MIVDPDFFDHWRTLMVIAAINDQMAPMYIMRIWGHCQRRKSDRFKMPTLGLKAQCRYPGDADTFEKALIEAEFIKREGDEVIVIGWAEQNASLIAAWENGSKGGRPKKEPTNKQSKTHGIPIENQDVTKAKPIREDKNREDKENSPIPPKGGDSSVHAISLPTYLANCKDAGIKPIPEGCSVFEYAEKAGIPNDFLRLQWLEFRDRYSVDGAKRYKAWSTVFAKSVRGNWFKLWYHDPKSGQFALTTIGVQAEKAHKEL